MTLVRIKNGILFGALYCVLSVIIGSGLLAQANEEGQQDTLWTFYQEEPVIVTANRIGNNIYRTTYSADHLEQSSFRIAEPTVSLSEALEKVPGLIVNNRHNQAMGERISSRGLGSRAQFGVRGIKIIVDDIPLTLPDGQAQTSNIDLGSAESIEVIRGPASSLYGNAAGGVIEIQTETLSQPQSVMLEGRYLSGAFQMDKWQMKALGNTHGFNYTVNVNQTQSDGFRDHSASKYSQLNSILSYDVTEQIHITGIVNYYDAPYLLNPSSLSEQDARENPAKSRGFIIQQGSGEQARQMQGGISMKYTLSNDDFVKITTYGVGRSLLNPIPGRIIELDRFTGGVRSSFHKNIEIFHKSGRIILGTDYEFQNDGRQEYENNGLNGENIAAENIFDSLNYGEQLIDQEEHVSGFGPFIQAWLALNKRLRLQAGLRYDSYNFGVNDNLLTDNTDNSGDIRMNQVSPMFGINYLLYPNMSLYGNLSTAFQTPTTSELSNRPDGEGGFNKDLEPEYVRSVELGARGRLFAPHLRYNLSLFSMNITNMIIPYQIEDVASEEVFHENAGEARNRGVEVLMKWSPFQNFYGLVSYTAMNFLFQDYLVELGDGENEQLKRNNVPGVPPQKLYAEMGYTAATGLFGELNLSWMDQYYTNNFNGPPPGVVENVENYINRSYVSVGLRTGNTFELSPVNLRIFGGVNNLFDQRYNSSVVPNAFGGNFFEPAPGRNWYLGVQLSFLSAN